MRRALLVLAVLSLAVLSGAAVRRTLKLSQDWQREASGYLPFIGGGEVGIPIMQTYCDAQTGDRIYLVVSNEQEGAFQRVRVQGMSVVPRGCAEWPRF